MRVFLLKAQSKLYDMLMKFRRDKNIVRVNEKKSSNSILNYSIEDIKFDNNLIYSTDILAICRKLE